MNRRNFLANVLVLPAFSAGGLSVLVNKTEALFAAPPFRRVRPGDAGWPSAAAWEKLKQAVNGHLVKVSSPLDGCKVAGVAGNCKEAFDSWKNPYYISDSVALTQSSGW